MTKLNIFEDIIEYKDIKYTLRLELINDQKVPDKIKMFKKDELTFLLDYYNIKLIKNKNINDILKENISFYYTKDLKIVDQDQADIIIAVEGKDNYSILDDFLLETEKVKAKLTISRKNQVVYNKIIERVVDNDNDIRLFGELISNEEANINNAIIDDYILLSVPDIVKVGKLV